MMEKCSDGKRAKSGKSLGNMTAKWDARFVVMSRAGVWWYKTEEDFKAKEQASGCMLELASAEINVRVLNTAASFCMRTVFTGCMPCDAQYDESFQWMQFISPERILSIRPVDRYEDLRLWISSLGNKGNTNSGKRITKLPDQPTEWEDLLGHEFGMVTSDLGCSFHGVIAATGGLNDDDMIGYLSKGDALQLVSWPEHTVVIDRYGYGVPPGLRARHQLEYH